MSLTIKDMLLIEEPTIKILKDELMTVSGWFILPSFVMALVLEYFGEFKFLEVGKKLILIMVFMGSFYTFHSEAVNLSFKASDEILKKVSPRNIFLRNWTEVKVKTNEKTNWSMLEKFAIPNVNDLLGTTFFILSKAFIWILKLIYSVVYHLTYVFAPLTAILYFFPITKSSIAGTIQSSLWCILMPVVLVSILAIVGNSIQAPAGNGELAIISIDHILWLFGVTLLLLMSPILTLGILRGGGVAMSGSAIGAMMTNSGMKVLSAIPIATRQAQGVMRTTRNTVSKGIEATSRTREQPRNLLSKDQGKSIETKNEKLSESNSRNQDHSSVVREKDGRSEHRFQGQEQTNMQTKATNAPHATGKDSKTEQRNSDVKSSNQAQPKDGYKNRSEMKEGKPQVQSKIHSKEKSPEIFREQKRELKEINNKESFKESRRSNAINRKENLRRPREVRNEV